MSSIRISVPSPSTSFFCTCRIFATEPVSNYRARDEVDNSGWAVSTLQAALWAFQTTKNFEDGMIAAVNLGGDSDTIGAVYGQIAGAFYGIENIPERWLSAIKDREKVNKLIEDFLSVAIQTGEAE